MVFVLLDYDECSPSYLQSIILLIAAHPILSVLRMTYAFITRSMFKKLYWAIPVSLLAVAFYVWLVSFTMDALK